MKKILKNIVIILFVAALPFIALFTWTRITAWQNTVYAQDFSQEKFDQVTVGMDVNQVKELLGEPLNTGGGEGSTLLMYSDREESTHFFVKGLLIKDAKVAEKSEYFYMD